MIIDTANYTAPVDSYATADAVVIGAGPAGIVLAHELGRLGHSVLLLESGGLKSSAASEGLNRGSIADSSLHPPADWFRRRVLGGASTIWGGRLAPLTPLDLEARPKLGLPGWPISYAELSRFYLNAMACCEGGQYNFTIDAAAPGGLRPILANVISDDVTDARIERFSRPTDFGRKYYGILRNSNKITLVLNATVTTLLLGENGGHADGVLVRTLSGKLFRVEGKKIIIASGGLEAPRLLLASARLPGQAALNRYHQLGRYYMSHLAGVFGEFHPSPDNSVFHGYGRSRDGVYYRRRLTVTEAAQRHYDMGAAIARLHHPAPADPSHGLGILSALVLGQKFITREYASRLHGRGEGRIAAHLGNILASPVKTFGGLSHLAAGRLWARRKLPSLVAPLGRLGYTLDFHAEQLPNWKSSLRLDDACDRLGVPRLMIDWRITAQDRHTIERAASLFHASLNAPGVGVFSYSPETVADEILGFGAYGGHHLGATRMSETPQSGVVDRNLRVHGIENLYVVGGSVFASSAAANPTLTVVALALRLAAHLATLLSRETVPIVRAGLRTAEAV
jgi:choline dehydrogenase-like flavoprotein